MNIGELRAYNYLKSQGYIVEDTTDNSNYWDKDIDFVIYDNKNTYTVEVKWDNVIHKSGNMFIETITDIDKEKEGWFNFCQADFIYYGDSVNKLFYIFKTEDLRAFVESHYLEERKAADYYTGIYSGIVKKVSQGLLVPIKLFSQQYDVQVVMLDKLEQGYIHKEIQSKYQNNLTQK